MSKKTSHPEIIISNGLMSATTLSFEERVVLGTVGYSSGRHYWEVQIDRYDNRADPAFGVARHQVARDRMLGKDAFAYSMYIDAERSWFMHAAQHTNRIALIGSDDDDDEDSGGMRPGSVIGVDLNLDEGTLSFWLNGELHGGQPAFTGLPKDVVFYPAFSLSKNVQITLHSNLEPPLLLSIENSSDSD